MSKKNLLMLFLIIILLFPVSSIRAEEIDITKKGNITINYRYENKVFDNTNIKLYKIADINQNGEYTYVDIFQGQEQDLGNKIISEQVTYAKNLEEYISTNSIEPDNLLTTNQEGQATTDNLSVGLYLLTYESFTDSQYIYNTLPVLISIPTSENSMTEYDIEVNPKVETTTINSSNTEEKTTGSTTTTTTTGTKKVPKTNDNIMKYIAILVISIIGVIIVVLYKNIKRKKEKNEKDI